MSFFLIFQHLVAKKTFAKNSYSEVQKKKKKEEE